MKKDKEITPICHKCDHYFCSAGGCVEICHARRIGSKYIAHMPQDYIDERMSANKTNCKEFKRINTQINT
jgi:hypothetical protein